MKQQRCLFGRVKLMDIVNQIRDLWSCGKYGYVIDYLQVFFNPVLYHKRFLAPFPCRKCVLAGRQELFEKRVLDLCEREGQCDGVSYQV